MDLTLELRHALRSLRRHRGLALAAAVTLGLGIGATLTMAGIIERGGSHPIRWPCCARSRL